MLFAPTRLGLLLGCWAIILFAQPQPILNRTNSLVIERVTEQPLYYDVVVRNNSTAGVKIVAFTLGEDRAVFMRDVQDGVIAPGASHTLTIGKPQSTEPHTVTLEAAVFLDGQPEGNLTAAALMDSAQSPSRYLQQRAQVALQKILADHPGGSTAQIEAYRAWLAEVQMDPAWTERFLDRYSSLSPEMRGELWKNLMEGFASSVTNMQQQLLEYEKKGAQPFADWAHTYFNVR